MIFKNEAQTRAAQGQGEELVRCLQASPRSCIALKINVLRARNVTQGWHDWFDTPDPYLKMRIPTSAEIVQRTKCVSNNKNPVWNEKPFVFHIDPVEDNVLELTLWDEDINDDDQIGDPVFLMLKDMQLDKPEQSTLKFGKVPTVAVLGSGGGYRATAGFSAACCALEEIGLMDCTRRNIRKQLQWGPFWLLTPRRVMHYVKDIIEKWKQGQPVSLTDFYGHCVGESLLGPKKNSVKLSHQKRKVECGCVPMPIYTAINSRRDISADSFAEWVEFTPYEIGMDKYGTFMKTELFGSKFFCGKLVEKFPESPLYYLQEQQFLSDKKDSKTEDGEDDEELGKFGGKSKQKVTNSLMEKLKTAVETDEEKLKIDGKATKSQKAEKKEFRKKLLDYVMEKLPGLQTRSQRAALIHNFLRGLGLNALQDGSLPQPYLESDNVRRKQMELIDAGLMFNSPYPPLLRKERSVDLILSFDFSARETDEERPFKNIKLAEEWAKRNGLLFPPIDADEQYERDGMKECYVFKHPTDPACPIVLHFVLINKTYRDYRRPGVPRTTIEQKEAGDFPVFNDPQKRYSTFNLKYSHDIFDKLSGLVEFNTMLNEQLIKDTMAECVQKRRSMQICH
ncbi:Cytosolic phospholipase A2 [Acropora cervicornis]|uniref:Phospholipase A2 n=1 Tax=Acropora cervicornis TaxID=6130 RepID=A0AAD9QJZ6_ACRCE|nr:Cytosolic phospholipase A2 [Acropora cervicornis]